MGTITKNFSYSEMEKSDVARQRGITNVITTFEVRDAVKELATELLQPLRDAWGGPITITSGYRCAALNAVVGGSRTSAHVSGYAADLVPANGRIDEFCGFAEKWLRDTGKTFDQCARESDRKGNRWLHLGLKGPDGRQLRRFYTWTKR